jgi:hypothetical protein
LRSINKKTFSYGILISGKKNQAPQPHMMPNAIPKCNSGNGDANSESLPDLICKDAVLVNDPTKSNAPGNHN